MKNKINLLPIKMLPEEHLHVPFKLYWQEEVKKRIPAIAMGEKMRRASNARRGGGRDWTITWSIVGLPVPTGKSILCNLAASLAEGISETQGQACEC